MRKGLMVSVVVASLLLGVGSLQAKEMSVNHQKQVRTMKNYVKNEVNFQSSKFKMASKDISLGLNNTIKAIDLLGKKDNKKAQKLLEEATKAFDRALKIEPRLKLVPIDNEIMVYNYQGSVKSIKLATSLAKDALKKHDLQFVRDVIDPLKDEIDISTHYIPMDLYPQSTKIALSLLKKGKSKEALQELVLGLSTIVGDEVVIPIPLLTAQDLVVKASKIDKKKKKEALALLDQAKVELERAKYLGYTIGNEAAYKELTNKINGIEKEIKGKNIVEKLYTDLKAKIKALVSKTRSHKKELKSGGMQSGLSIEHKDAVKEENKDVENFVTKGRLNAF